MWAWGVICGQGGGCDGHLVVGVVVLMVIVVVVVLVVVVVVVVVGVVVVVLLVVVVAVLALWPARCRAVLVMWRCHVVVAVVSVCGVGREPLSTVESSGSRGLWC